MIENSMYALYIILGIVPFSYIRIYPFSDKMRLKPKYFWCIYGCIVVIEIIWYIAIENGISFLGITDNEFVRLVFYFIYLLVSIIFINESPFKHLIVWSVCVIFSSTLTAFSFWIDRLFPSSIPFLAKNITMLVLLPLFLRFGFVFVNKHIMPLINQSNKKTNRLISTLLMLIIVMVLVTVRELPFNAIRPWSIFVVRVIASTITFVVCTIFSEIIKEQTIKLKIMEESSQKEKMLDVSTEQFIALSDKIDETRRARHDLKFHVSAIKSMASKENYTGILEYLENDSLLPNDDVLSFCDHPTFNIVFSYYRDIALSNHIDFEVVAKASQDFFLSNNEIWVLLGNLLENAIEASRYMDKQNRKIQVKMNANQSSLILTVDNRYDESKLNQRGNRFISLKDKGGVGL